MHVVVGFDCGNMGNITIRGFFAYILVCSLSTSPLV